METKASAARAAFALRKVLYYYVLYQLLCLRVVNTVALLHGIMDYNQVVLV